MTDIRPRAQWGARPPRGAQRVKLPTPELWLHHTAGQERGDVGMRSIQAAHMAPLPDGRGWVDVGYSFVIDPTTLTIYEGRGAGRPGAPPTSHNGHYQ